ncbi:MAG TPA: hypothetical protein VK479_04565 [Micropepsaceae bacterium]|nr:hypothetical protein [Micropepsaceae bacterium]
MKRSGAMILAALLSCGAAVPALAAWDRVGSVDFSYRDTHDATLGNFKGYAVGLTARNSDVMCDSVMATFGNGRTREIFRGELPRGQRITINLPGSQRSIDRVDFDCRPTEGYRARVDIATDTGGYPNDRRPYYDNGPQYPDYNDRSQDRDTYNRPPSWDRN